MPSWKLILLIIDYKYIKTHDEIVWKTGELHITSIQRMIIKCFQNVERLSEKMGLSTGMYTVFEI
jgi:hypothetical protein